MFYNYLLWEDYQGGLYDTNIKYSENSLEVLVRRSISVLTDNDLFLRTAKKILRFWPTSSDVNLSIASRNRQAWIGQASCCYLYKVPEYITKFAWNLLTPKQQIKANKTASKIIKLWEKKKYG